MLLSLVIPTYNERENVPSLVERATEVLKNHADNFEIIVVDDDSPDGTWRVAEELARRNPHLRVLRRRGERGLASAVVAGWRVARGEIVGVMDGDLQHPPAILPALLEPIVKGRADIAVGSRYVEGGGTSGWGIHRRFLSRGLSLVANLVFRGVMPPLRDPMSGIFLARRSVIQNINFKPRGYKVLLEVLAKGAYETIVEVPFTFVRRQKGSSKAGPKECFDSVVHLGGLLANRRSAHAITLSSPQNTRKPAGLALMRTDVLSLLLVLALGITALPHPFQSDQAQYTFTAENMRDGWALYRDAWDVKQPGIFYFYFAAGSLFGFNELGIHVFDLVWMLVLSLVLVLAFASRFKERQLASLLPVCTAGMYFVVTGPDHQTQPETVVGLPMFLSLWFCDRAVQPATRRVLSLFLSGVMGGVVLVLKLMFLPIPLAFWFMALWQINRVQGELSLKRLAQSTLAIAAGVITPLLATAVDLYRQDALEIASWTFLSYPVNAVTQWPLRINFRTLIDSLLWFLRNFAPLLALSVIGAAFAFRLRRDYLTLGLILWVVAGALVILLQRLSWFQSHFMLFLVPLGVLAVGGLDVLWLSLKRLRAPMTLRQIRVAAAVSVGLLLAPIWTAAGLKGAVLARNSFASLLTERELRRHQSKVSHDYSEALREVAFLKSSYAVPGNIYVFGNAIYYYLSGRDPAIPILVRHFVPTFLWAELVAALYRDPRPSYIFIAKDYLERLREHTPEAAPYIDAAARFTYEYYDVLHTNQAGTWYVLRESDPRA